MNNQNNPKETKNLLDSYYNQDMCGCEEEVEMAGYGIYGQYSQGSSCCCCC